MPEESLAELASYRESERFAPLEKLALELADAMTLTPADVGDDLRSSLLEHLTEGQLTELVAAVAWENHRARLNRALGVRSMGFSGGDFCVVPVGGVGGETRGDPDGP